jgi:predicted nucleic acid-binding protein
MGYKIFLDINVVADFLDTERKEHVNTTKLFEEIEKENFQAYFSESVVNTSSYILRKLISLSDFKLVMDDLVSFIKILPCTNVIIQEAYKNAKNDLEDAVLYQIAMAGKMDYFVTSDTKDFKKIQHPSLRVVSAKQLLEFV